VRLIRQIVYDAKDDAEALAIARERLGRDAVILSTRTVKRGGFLGLFRRKMLSVTAGLFEDERTDPSASEDAKERILAFQRLLEVKQAVKGTLARESKGNVVSAPADPFVTPEVAPLADVANENVRLDLSTQARTLAAAAYGPASRGAEPLVRPPMAPETVPSEDSDLRKQVEAIHASLQTVLSRLEERRESLAPLPGGEEEDENVRLLANMDVDIQHARALAKAFRKEGSGKPFVAWLEKRIPVVGSDPLTAMSGKKVMFIGPTGVGKTTSIAKLAAIHSLWEKKRVLLLTADTYRIAAVEQLRTYARILGIPIEVVYEPEEIPSLLQKHDEMDLILMDTAGRSQRDGKRLDELCGLYEAYRPEAVHLVMSANMKYGDMLDVIDRMGVVPVSCLLFTKLDETLTYGNLMNAVLDFDRPLSFITTGQNVPNDIEVAQSERIARLLVGGDRVGR